MSVLKVLLCHADGTQTPISVPDLAEAIAHELTLCPNWTDGTIQDAIEAAA